MAQEVEHLLCKVEAPEAEPQSHPKQRNKQTKSSFLKRLLDPLSYDFQIFLKFLI
jgi:hypothetical protein